ncbi:MAG: hypothetical protein A3G24_02445 [Betaproteobacteria bacterium RIFCSPLOWO2_12_FULL_62_13]|nr:MAG: hypothetical protein A3G24_02445 [Betaproteobacteria bacterium RIFCSPLOWO2_12_FULL_62_13]
MNPLHERRLLPLAALTAGWLAAAFCGNAGAKWKPERPVELIASVAPGGNQGLTARAIRGIWQER